MADIHQYLIQAAHKEKAQHEQSRLATCERESLSDYQADNLQFKLPLGKLKADGGDMQQFYQFYYQRLEQLRHAVKEAAELKWDMRAEYVDNILDLRPGVLTVMIGTIFKLQKGKPNVINHLTGVIPNIDPMDLSFGEYEGPRSSHLGEEDQCILEDSSGRITIKKKVNDPNFDIDSQVTGTIVALLGRSDDKGYFQVQDTCLAGIPFKPVLPASIEIKQRGLFEDDLLQKDARKFVAFTSGLNFGDTSRDFEQCEKAKFMLSTFLKGQHLNTKMNQLAAQVTRLVICGDSIRENKHSDDVFRGSYRALKQNKEVYKYLGDSHTMFEKWLSSFIDVMDTDVMPGAQDFSNSYFPQQPVNSFLFPELERSENLNLVTNPHKFTMGDGLEFLGTSGQNLHDIQLYTKLREEDRSPAALLRLLVGARHLCPTAPDTLRCFPFREEDPFVINTAPEVLFAGCQPCYSEETIFQHKNSQESAVKVLSVPTFAKTRSIVLLDLTTLESYELKFGKPCQQQEEASSQMEQ